MQQLVRPRLVRAQPAAAAGFTVVELMVTLAVAAILAALAVPTMRSVIENTHMRATAQSLQNGLAMARAEAVRLNTQVELVLTGAGWSIQRVSDGSLLQQASGKEMASGTTVTTTPTGSDRVTYDAFGRTVATNPTDNSATITQIDVVATHPSGTPGYKPLRIQLTSGGLARLCDPAAASTEPKACL
jgi:type IV fimbrial biogenesis protein FimT